MNPIQTWTQFQIHNTVSRALCKQLPDYLGAQGSTCQPCCWPDKVHVFTVPDLILTEKQGTFMHLMIGNKYHTFVQNLPTFSFKKPWSQSCPWPIFSYSLIFCGLGPPIPAAWLCVSWVRLCCSISQEPQRPRAEIFDQSQSCHFSPAPC